MNPFRRQFLVRALRYGILGMSGLLGLPRSVFSMGKLPNIQGMHEVHGDVRINGSIAEKGALVRVGDTVTTGEDSRAIFVVGRDAYLMHANTRLVIESESNGALSDLLRVVRGRVLSVLSSGGRQVITPTAVIGIRGTGMYVEANPEMTYVCTCYGEVDIEVRDAPGIMERVKTTHHESPRTVLASGGERSIIPAPMMNHTDEELIMLEALVNRRPPFATSYRGRYR